MNRDTSIPDVARSLPTTAARLLLVEPAPVQHLVCAMVRDAVVFWEESGVVLDPIQYETVVTALVIQTTVSARLHETMREQLRDAHRLIEALGSLNAQRLIEMLGRPGAT